MDAYRGGKPASQVKPPAPIPSAEQIKTERVTAFADLLEALAQRAEADQRTFDPAVHDTSVPTQDLMVDGQIKTSQHHLITDVAPPGFHLPTYDAWAYVLGADAQRPVFLAKESS